MCGSECFGVFQTTVFGVAGTAPVIARYYAMHSAGAWLEHRKGKRQLVAAQIYEIRRRHFCRIEKSVA